MSLLFPSEFTDQVSLSCRVKVGGEWLIVQQSIVRAVYEDPAARKVIEDHLRQALMMKILERWTPAIRVAGL